MDNDHDDTAVDNLSTCKEAAEELKLNFTRAENIGNYPKGCYVAGDVFFNQHSTGSRQSNARQICKAIGKEKENSFTSHHLLYVF